MALGQTRPASRRQAELDAWLSRAAAGDVVDLASLRGVMRAPTGLLQQLAEAVLDNSVSIVPEGGLPVLRAAWARFEAQRGGVAIDPEQGMAVVADPLAAFASVILGLVSPGRHVAVVEPAPPQIVEIVRRTGAMARAVSMRPTEWEFEPEAFAHQIGPRTDLIVVADPNPLSGQYLPDEARASILAAVRQFGCGVLLDQSARHSVVGDDDPGAAAFVAALGPHCLRIDMPAASVLASAASVAGVFGAPELIAPVRSAASAFGLGAGVSAQGVNARRFEDGSAIDDIATLNGIVASGRALMLDGLDDIGVADLGGPGGWYVPVRAKALYAGTQDIGEVLAAKAGLGVLPLAPFYVEGSSDPYILMAYLRDAGLLENAIERLAEFYAGEDVRYEPLALPAPDTDYDAPDDEFEDEFDDEYEDDDGGEDDHVVDEVAADLVMEIGAAPLDVPPAADTAHVVLDDAAPAEEPEPVPVPEEGVSDDASDEGGEDQDEYLFRSDDVDEHQEPVAETAPQVPDPDPWAEGSAQVIEMAEADAKYRAAMAGLSEEGGHIAEELHHPDDMDPGREEPATPDAVPAPQDTTAGAETYDDPDGEEETPRHDPVVLPFGRWRETRRARRERREEPVIERAPAPVEDPAPEPDTPPEEPPAVDEQEVAVFRLSVPDIASPEISVPRQPAPDPDTQAGDGDPDDVLTLSEDDALPDPASEPVPEPAGEGGEAASSEPREKKPRDDRPFFFDDPVV